MKGRRAHFEGIYEESADPWDYETSAYEKAKYDATLRALPRERYRNAVEAGCSIGVLSEMLAARADRFLGLDLSHKAVAVAQRRLAAFPDAAAAACEIPADWPGGAYDLVVLSEIVYYLSEAEIEALAALLARDMTRNGDGVIVSWNGEAPNEMEGRAATRLFLSALSRRLEVVILSEARSAEYDLTVFRCV